MMNRRRFTIQFSDHPEEGRRIPSAEAGASWKTVYDGTPAGDTQWVNATIKAAVDSLAEDHPNARALCGPGAIGRLWYAVLRVGGVPRP